MQHFKAGFGKEWYVLSSTATLLTKIENIINSRPLKYVVDDSDGISYPLTPSQLVKGINLSSYPNDAHFEIINTHQRYQGGLSIADKLLSQFCNRWKGEFWLSLLEKYRPQDYSMFKSDIKVDDICILHNSKRAFWKLCKAEKLVTGKDSSVRSAKLSVLPNGSKKLFLRSLKYLVPPEIRVTTPSPDKHSASLPSPTGAQAQAQHQQHSGRAKRNVAVIHELKRKYRS